MRAVFPTALAILAALSQPAAAQDFAAFPVNTPECQAFYDGGPGDSPASAIFLRDAYDEWSGVEAEYDYIDFCLPGWRADGQTLVEDEFGIYDELRLIGPNGESNLIYFDITDWYGVM